MPIRPATTTEAALLPLIEQSAGLRFGAAQGLEWLAEGDNRPVAFYREMIEAGACWVAVDEADRPQAFLCAQTRGRELHIWELAVVLELQGHGVGRALLAHAFDWARAHALDAVTLTTFRDLVWNERFYLRQGFITLTADEVAADQRLREILLEEITRGLPAHRRCAMRRPLAFK